MSLARQRPRGGSSATALASSSSIVRCIALVADVVVPLRTGGELADAPLEHVRRAEAFGREQRLERLQPASIVAPPCVAAGGASFPVGDRRDQAIAKLVPGEAAVLVQRHRHPEETCLP